MKQRGLGLVVASAALALVACSKKKDEGGGGSASGGGKASGGTAGGTSPGKLAPRELAAKNGSFTVKGDMPAAWTPEEIPDGVKLSQLDKGTNQGHVQVTLTMGEGAEQLAKDTASLDQAYGSGSLVVQPTEIAPGRWGRMHKQVGMQWKPGVDMFEGHVFWALPDKQIVRCWVRWLSAAPEGGLDLCKSIEVTPKS